MNLRERKKRDTLGSIVATARELFTTNGYKATTMGEIAESSNVAVGTLYNYFKSKAEIMLAIVSEDSADMLQPFDASFMDSTDVEDLIWEFTAKLITFLNSYPRELIGELIGIYWETGHENLVDGLVSIDMMILNQITQMIASLKSRKKIKEETDPEVTALALYGMAGTAIMLYSVDHEMTIEKTQNMIASMIGHFCRGILPDKKEKE